MYKVMYDGMIIDILPEIKYAKYMKKSKKTYVTSRSSANCILASNGKDRYHLLGVPYPEGCDLKTVTVAKISEKEYEQLTENLNIENSFTILGLRAIKKKKISELRSICDNNILNGVHIMLSDGNIHHFTMSIEDQLNLLEIRHLISIGEESFIYHETGGEYMDFTADDMNRIIDATFQHKQKHLLHFNKLKKYINQLDNFDSINNVDYSLEI